MGMYREFALRAMSMGRRRGRPPVFSAQAFWPYAAERTLAQAVREALLESWRRELAGAVEDSDEGDGGFESSVRGAAERAAEAISANAGESLARFSEMTIGVPYLPAGTERAVLGEWTETFVKLCRSADAQGKADIARAVSGGKMRGENMRQVESAVEASLKGKAKAKAELIARTETGKLNNACTMAGYREAGITRYRWLATPDERTRPSHAAMNGRICAVGEPDTWYEDTERGLERRSRTRDMYHGDPGTDFQCRCTCVPWDAAVDSKYGVREVPEPEPKEPSPLEREREENERLREQIERERSERAERERELENARKLAERRTEILRSANERHAARTAEMAAEIRERWNKRSEIICSLPKKTWTLAKNVDNDYVNAIKEQLKKRPKNYIKASRLLENDIDVISKDEAYFSPFDNKISIYMKCAKTNPRGQGSTMLHEQGHALDFAIGKACGHNGYISEAMNFGKSVSKALRNSLLKEADDFFQQYEKTNPLPSWSKERKQDAYIYAKFLDGHSSLPVPDKMIFGKFTNSKHIDFYHEHEASAISDIIHGVLKGRVALGYGHKKSYWNTKNIGAECFTHFGTLTESEFGRKFLKTYLSGPLKEWENMIKLGADKAPSVEESMKKH